MTAASISAAGVSLLKTTMTLLWPSDDAAAAPVPAAFGIVEGASELAWAREWAVLEPMKGVATGRTDAESAFESESPDAGAGLSLWPWCEGLLLSIGVQGM